MAESGVSYEILGEKDQVKGLTIVHKKGGPVERSVGRLFSLPENLSLLIPTESFKSFPKEKQAELAEQFRDVPWRGNVEMYLNHSPFWRQMKRLFSSDRRVNFFLRATVGIPTTGITWLGGKLFRHSAYNPFAETIQHYKSNKGIAAHEIGHAIDMESANHPNWKAIAMGLPLSRSVYEWRASTNAMKHLREEERAEAKKVLEPMAGAQIGNDVAWLALPGIQNPAAFAGLIFGHIHARATDKDRNWFFDSSQSVEPVVSRVDRSQVPRISHPTELSPIANPISLISLAK